MQLIFLFFWKEMDKAYLNAPIWQSMQIFENFIAQFEWKRSQNGPMKCLKAQNKVKGHS